jgi:hypothetical protein
MSTEDIYFYFFVWLAIAVVLVIAAAALLIGVIWCAHRIATLASVALEVVEDIENNTKPIWELDTTNQVAGSLLSGAKAIEENAGMIVAALTKGDKSDAA